ncbi:SRPBCC family protein [Undibacterium sp. TS12]|uniref:SRPBCC family protein n=1 Tax=Undibacterium sp. TS12 TaxID=2908202 RepID=UPI001F4C9521|nr:SRPBCC family protein [Undibacterium sp. TS12]MCH8619617.1 SRPBCC family protein [Undibacterium sp. TS12]
MSTHIYNAIEIQRPVQQVFDYACTPTHWPDWHPSSLKLYTKNAGIAKKGARFEEDVRAGGRTGHLVWTVTEYTEQRSWTGQATVDNGANLTVIYHVSATPTGTLFERHLHYDLPGFVLKILNLLVLRRRIVAESALSLQRLQDVLQAGQERGKQHVA